MISDFYLDSNLQCSSFFTINSAKFKHLKPHNINLRHLSAPDPWHYNTWAIRTFSLLSRPAIVCVWHLDFSLICVFFPYFLSAYYLLYQYHSMHPLLNARILQQKSFLSFREAFSDTLPASAAELALQMHLGSIIVIENSQLPTEYDFKCLQHQSSFQSWRFWPVHYLCMSTQLSNLAHTHTHIHIYTYTHVLAMILWNLVWFSPMLHRWQTQAGGASAKSCPKFGEGRTSRIWVAWFTHPAADHTKVARVIACTSLFWGVHINGKEKAIFKRLGRVSWQSFSWQKSAATWSLMHRVKHRESSVQNLPFAKVTFQPCIGELSNVAPSELSAGVNLYTRFVRNIGFRNSFFFVSKRSFCN